eukprot:gnl/Spiro4/24541_TR12170_c0_g1_i1.p1 gnl/Spiro4/24541_TR12170_c0_g1~~gnl/Spiro4/24541_TR12170_c0_g1_i1.p1  ORF type:complete len:396 (-),score=91.76 gnl/Spiro4/24541_TR12170_c0_g1_i1:180-1340(-)
MADVDRDFQSRGSQSDRRRRNSRRKADDQSGDHVRFKVAESGVVDEPHDKLLPSFACLTCDQVRNLMQLLQSKDLVALEAALEELFHLSERERNPRSGILLDFYVYNLTFAQKLDFDAAKTATFFSVLKTVNDQATMESPGLNADEAFNQFKTLLLDLSNPRIPSQWFFSIEELQAITEYATRTYFKHFNLYKAVFTELQDVASQDMHLFVEVPLPFPPLQDAVTRHELEEALAAERERLRVMEEAEISLMTQEDVTLPPSPPPEPEPQLPTEEPVHTHDDSAQLLAERIQEQVQAALHDELALGSATSLGTDPNELISMLETAVVGLRTKLMTEMALKETQMAERIVSLEKKLAATAPSEKKAKHDDKKDREDRSGRARATRTDG